MKYNYSSESKITYSVGSQIGDNYGAKTVVVDIKDNRELKLELV